MVWHSAHRSECNRVPTGLYFPFSEVTPICMFSQLGGLWANRVSRRENQDHLQREAQDIKRAAVPGGKDCRERRVRCQTQGKQNDKKRKADRKYERVWHDLFEQVDKTSHDAAAG